MLSPQQPIKTRPKFAPNKQKMTGETQINNLIKDRKRFVNLNTNLISDGYHTFGELYEHRITLFIALCKNIDRNSLRVVWRSKADHAGHTNEGWFLLGIDSLPGQQITYHLPEEKWDLCSFAVTLETAPKFDGHTGADVLQRLLEL